MSCLVLDRKPGGFSFENCYSCCGAGTAADTQMGYVGAALVLGGVDSTGPHLYSIAPHGSTDKLPYITMGSGSLACMSVLESRFKFDMEVSSFVYLEIGYILASILLSYPTSVMRERYYRYWLSDTNLTITSSPQLNNRPCQGNSHCNTTGHISNFQQDEAVKLVRDGIAAGIFNDMGSGSNVDICIITKDGTTYIRSYDEANVKGKRAEKYNPPEGTTSVLHKSVHHVEFDVVTTRVVRDIPAHSVETMDLS
ncbi:unnamed protein product [Schistosoma margrebowiei]|uniref:Proteasome beta subunit C-terminal domain-containing protein n=1 Tax=Schistosoma margrebowiei TaxID=48269 RepID=A0A183MZQ1_9TREM|nr:unnamed protein product [Schistosoma margrebowiei]